ncbi:MAG TPA: tetratricopeptide repeat protein [Treponemataceae bacterium]|nr:tetratricopeptide repeat protein [Treponemataceae bacterium]
MKKIVAICVSFFVCFTLFSQDALITGLEAYARSDWSTATLSFRKALMGPSGSNNAETWYWLIMSEISAEDFSVALTDIEKFSNTFPKDPRNADMNYQKGRIQFLKGSYESSIQSFYNFLSSWPEHSLVSSAYYWIGESLFSVGRHEEAAAIFRIVLERYPEAIKREAAQYRLAIIGQGEREGQLLRLLKQSHEESLKIIEDYQRREKSYEQAITAYQKRISDMIKDTRLGELEKQLGDEKVRNSQLLDTISMLEIEKAELAAAMTLSGVSIPQSILTNSHSSLGVSSDPDSKRKSLEELREKAIALQFLYDTILEGEK